MKSAGDAQPSFRDRISTVNGEGERIWVYPKKPKGRLYRLRSVVSVILLAFFYISPHIQYKGDQWLLLNVLERKFILFGIIFWPQDFHLVVLSFLTALVFIILFTVVFGRIFCGWICPQTIFMEMVFRKIEYLIEGDFQKQKRLASQERNAEKILKKTLKHGIFYLISFITANTFLAYLTGSERLLTMIGEGPVANPAPFAALLVFSGVFYFIFAFFREQVCIIVCPYGRLQGVLLVPQTIVVAYDPVRGEPRGEKRPGEGGKAGDCIDCKNCVIVCPTNIDIRNGTQLECINCAACIDACNSVMDRTGKPRGLIRYDSEKGITEGKRRIINARSIGYSIVLFILLTVVGSIFIFRSQAETTILRAKGTLYQEYGTDSYSNLFHLELVNKTRKTMNITVRLISPAGEIRMIGDPIRVEGGRMAKGSFLAVLKKETLTSSQARLKFGVYNETALIQYYKASFVGPNSLDQPMAK